MSATDAYEKVKGPVDLVTRARRTRQDLSRTQQDGGRKAVYGKQRTSPYWLRTKRWKRR